jgi:hypothetical protein
MVCQSKGKSVNSFLSNSISNQSSKKSIVVAGFKLRLEKNKRCQYKAEIKEV